MCLATIKKQYEPPIQQIPVVRYKVFQVVKRNKKRGYTIATGYKFRLRKNVWLKANQTLLVGGPGDTYYRSGFHTFDSYRGAQRWRMGHEIIIPVLVKDIRTVGKQCDFNATVSDYMYIVSQDVDKAIDKWYSKYEKIT